MQKLKVTGAFGSPELSCPDTITDSPELIRLLLTWMVQLFIYRFRKSKQFRNIFEFKGSFSLVSCVSTSKSPQFADAIRLLKTAQDELGRLKTQHRNKTNYFSKNNSETNCSENHT